MQSQKDSRPPAVPRRSVKRPLERLWTVTGFWMPPLLISALVVVLSEELDSRALASLPELTRRMISIVLEMIAIMVPVALYLTWRYAARQQEATNRRLATEQSFRDDLAHMLVHDLKNPLVTAAMALSGVERGVRSGTMDADRALNALGIARDAIRRLEGMVGDILDVARGQVAEMPLRLDHGDIVSIVREAVAAQAEAVAAEGIELRQSVAIDRLPARIDADKVRRVLDNLLDNAIRFTARGGLIQVFIESRDDCAVITIRDNGEGIPPHLIGGIFDRFTQAQASRERSRRSVGLGLTFARLAVEAHGGQISVESEEQIGTAFTFSLPLTPKNADHGARDSVLQEGTAL